MPIKVKGNDKLSRKLKQLGVDVEQKAELALVAGGLVLQNGMKVRAPKKTRTLARSIHIGGHEDQSPDFNDAGEQSRGKVPPPERSKNKIKIFIGTNLIYAAIQEFGGEITPKRAPFLRFQIDGEWITARRVRIPAHPYVRPTMDEDGAEAKREVGAALRDIIRAAVK